MLSCVEYKKNFYELEARSSPEVIKLFSCSKHLSMKFVIFINITMPSVAIINFMLMWIEHGFLAHQSHSDKVSFWDLSSSVVVHPLKIDLNDNPS